MRPGHYVFLAVCVFAVWKWLQLEQTRTALAELRASHAEQQREVAVHNTKTIAALQAAVDLAEVSHAAETSALDRLLRAADTDRQRLRNAATAPIRGADPGTACTAERERAAALGQLLAEADELAEGFAAAAEQHAGEVRALLAAWPRTAPTEPAP